MAGGRWNAKGTHALYASTTLSLACLEILVHIKEPRLPADYAWVRIDVPHEQMDEALTKSNFSDESWCHRFGSDWLRTSNRAAIEVPSVIIPTEGNLLLNPRHAGFTRIAFSQATPFRFDPRLLKLGPTLL